MARVGRLAGALLAETLDGYYLVGDTKMPCDWAAAGFERPVDEKRPYVRLSRMGPVDLGKTWLTIPLEGEALAEVLVRSFVIERNGSVSERLWRLVTQNGDPDGEAPDGPVDAKWLAEMPAGVWQIVRSTVLRCV